MRWIVVNEFLDVFSDSEKLKEILKPVIKFQERMVLEIKRFHILMML